MSLARDYATPPRSTPARRRHQSHSPYTYQEELNENARNGVRATISGIKLLQGDLSEAWREGTTDYATVAMRYAITEEVTERASGKVVSGGLKRSPRSGPSVVIVRVPGNSPPSSKRSNKAKQVASGGVSPEALFQLHVTDMAVGIVPSTD
jgi:hypothetical protein